MTAALGNVYQPIAMIGAFRLAKPGSLWARQFYGPTSRRRTRSERRFGADYAAGGIGGETWSAARRLIRPRTLTPPSAVPGSKPNMTNVY